MKLPANSSFSQLYTYSVCPRKYFLSYIIGMREPPRERVTHGTAMHAAFAHVNRTIRTGSLAHHDDLMAIYTSRGGGRKEAAEAIFRRYLKEEAPAREPHHIEAHVSLLLRPLNVRLRGYVDLIGESRGSMRVTDFKCPARAPFADAANQSIQLTLYAAAAGQEKAELVHAFHKKTGAELVIQPTRITPERISQVALYVSGLERALQVSLQERCWPRRLRDRTCNDCWLHDVCWKGAPAPQLDVFKQEHWDPDAV